MIETPHLLITDDDRDFRETLRQLFLGRGYRTTTAADGEEAVRLAQEIDVHLILMDLQMPRLTGLEAVRQVKAARADLPCILISAAIDERVLAEAQQAAVYSVLRKPVRVVEVRTLVREALQATYGWVPRDNASPPRD